MRNIVCTVLLLVFFVATTQCHGKPLPPNPKVDAVPPGIPPDMLMAKTHVQGILVQEPQDVVAPPDDAKEGIIMPDNIPPRQDAMPRYPPSRPVETVVAPPDDVLKIPPPDFQIQDGVIVDERAIPPRPPKIPPVYGSLPPVDVVAPPNDQAKPIPPDVDIKGDIIGRQSVRASAQGVIIIDIIPPREDAMPRYPPSLPVETVVAPPNEQDGVTIPQKTKSNVQSNVDYRPPDDAPRTVHAQAKRDPPPIPPDPGMAAVPPVFPPEPEPLNKRNVRAQAKRDPPPIPPDPGMAAVPEGPTPGSAPLGKSSKPQAVPPVYPPNTDAQTEIHVKLPPPRGVIIAPPDDVAMPPIEGVAKPPRGPIVLNPQNDEVVIPPPKDIFIPPPRDVLIPPPKDIVIPPPKEVVVIPPPKEIVILPPKDGIVNPPPKDIVVLPPTDVVVIPPPKDILFPPKDIEILRPAVVVAPDIRIPPIVDGVAKPPRGPEDIIAPPDDMIPPIDGVAKPPRGPEELVSQRLPPPVVDLRPEVPPVFPPEPEPLNKRNVRAQAKRDPPPIPPDPGMAAVPEGPTPGSAPLGKSSKPQAVPPVYPPNTDAQTEIHVKLPPPRGEIVAPPEDIIAPPDDMIPPIDGVAKPPRGPEELVSQRIPPSVVNLRPEVPPVFPPEPEPLNKRNTRARGARVQSEQQSDESEAIIEGEHSLGLANVLVILSVVALVAIIALVGYLLVDSYRSSKKTHTNPHFTLNQQDPLELV